MYVLEVLRKGVLLERTYIHSRRLPLDHSRERREVLPDGFLLQRSLHTQEL